MSTALAPSPVLPPARNERLVVQDNSAGSHLFDTARFEHMQRIALAISKSALTPKHLKGANDEQTAANCLRVVNQAVRWGFDPFAVIDETYVVHGRLGYQGKLVAAVINARSNLADNLDVIYNAAKGDDFAAVVFGSDRAIPKEAWPLLKQYVERDNTEVVADLKMMGVRAIRITVGQAKTENDMWRKDPSQKLFYSGATKWARRHRPEIMLGVMTEDDLERLPSAGNVDLGPTVSTIAEVSRHINGSERATETPSITASPSLQTEPETSDVIDEAMPGETTDGELPSPLAGLRDQLDKCTSAAQINAVHNEYSEKNLTKEEEFALDEACAEAKERVKAAKAK